MAAEDTKTTDYSTGDLLTAAQAQQLLGKNKNTVAQMLKDGRLPWRANPLDRRVKLIPRVEVERLLREAGRLPVAL